LFEIVAIGDDVACEAIGALVGGGALGSVEEFAADEGRVLIVGVAPAVFVRAVKGRTDFALVGLLVHVDYPAGRAATGLLKLSCTNAPVHKYFSYKYYCRGSVLLLFGLGRLHLLLYLFLFDQQLSLLLFLPP
jgi:hypothetical protein